MIIDTFILITIAFFFLTGILLIWILPKYQTKNFTLLKVDEKFTLENEARKTMIQLLGGFFLLGTLFFSWNSYKLSQRNELSQNISDNLLLLANENSDSKVAAIYQLENIALNHELEREGIFQILHSYVKRKTTIKKNKPILLSYATRSAQEERDRYLIYWNSDTAFTPCISEPSIVDRYVAREDSIVSIGADIQAAINCLLRIKIKRNSVDLLDLSNLSLEGLSIVELDISRVDFRNSRLSYSTFKNMISEERTLFNGAELKFVVFDGVFNGYNFFSANIEGGIFLGYFLNCDFYKSNLYKSLFYDCSMKNPNFSSANMTSTNFVGGNFMEQPKFEKTILNCADLRDLSIKKGNFTTAIINEETYLPK